MYQIIMCDIRGVCHNDKPAEMYHPTHCGPPQLHGALQSLYCVGSLSAVSLVLFLDAAGAVFSKKLG